MIQTTPSLQERLANCRHLQANIPPSSHEDEIRFEVDVPAQQRAAQLRYVPTEPTSPFP